MQAVSLEDNLLEMPKPVFWGKYKKEKKITSLSSGGFAQRMVKLKKMSLKNILTADGSFERAKQIYSRRHSKKTDFVIFYFSEKV